MSNKKKINLKLIKHISLTIINYVAGSGGGGGLAGEDLEKVSGRYSIASSASGGGLARGAAEARLSLRSVCFTENRRIGAIAWPPPPPEPSLRRLPSLL